MKVQWLTQGPAEDILTRHGRKSTGVIIHIIINNSNNWWLNSSQVFQVHSRAITPAGWLQQLTGVFK